MRRYTIKNDDKNYKSISQNIIENKENYEDIIFEKKSGSDIRDTANFGSKQ
jgi:hypothetical protein